MKWFKKKKVEKIEEKKPSWIKYVPDRITYIPEEKVN